MKLAKVVLLLIVVFIVDESFCKSTFKFNNKSKVGTKVKQTVIPKRSLLKGYSYIFYTLNLIDATSLLSISVPQMTTAEVMYQIEVIYDKMQKPFWRNNCATFALYVLQFYLDDAAASSLPVQTGELNFIKFMTNVVVLYQRVDLIGSFYMYSISDLWTIQNLNFYIKLRGDIETNINMKMVDIKKMDLIFNRTDAAILISANIPISGKFSYTNFSFQCLHVCFTKNYE